MVQVQSVIVFAIFRLLIVPVNVMEVLLPRGSMVVFVVPQVRFIVFHLWHKNYNTRRIT